MHGVDGWALVAYEWDEKTGCGHLTYERRNPLTGAREIHGRSTPQPMWRGHTAYVRH
jgi:hypothetical protein